MLFSKIFKIFILFLTISALFHKLHANVRTLNEKCELHFTPTNEVLAPIIMEYARELDSQLSDIFPKNPRSTKRQTRRHFKIFFTDDVKNSIKTVQNKQEIIIRIGGISPDFQNNYQFLLDFFTAVTLQIMPYETENVRTKWSLPHWFFLALHSQIKNAFSGTRLLRNPKNMPGLQIFLEHKYFPDLISLEQCNGSKMSAVEMFFMQDCCRLIVYLGSSLSKKNQNVVALYLRELYLAETSSDPALFQRLIASFLQEHAVSHIRRMQDLPEKYTEKQQMEIFLKFHAEHLAFSFSKPASSKYLRMRFEEFQKVRFAELDQENKPTGKIIESTIDQLPELIKKHKNAKTVLLLKQGELLHFRYVSSSILSADINNLLNLLSEVRDSFFFGTSPREIRAAVKTVEEKLDHFEHIEKFLESTETDKLSPFQIFPYEFFAEKQYRNAAVPASLLNLMEQTEKEYLK